MAKALFLAVLFMGNCSCSRLAWSKLVHGTLVDDGRHLIPALTDILFGEEPMGTKRGAFGQVVLAEPRRLFAADEDPTDTMLVDAVLSYFSEHAVGHRLEFVEDYRKKADNTLSICFSQAVNGTRIYGTVACAEVRGNELLYAWHFFVVPPSVCTRPDISEQRAQEVVLNHLGTARPTTAPSAELNVAFIYNEPTLVWRIPVKGEQGPQTFFVHAKTGRIAAITTASYRPTDGSSFSDGVCATQGVVGGEA